ncbi:hypothetical protein AB6A40_007463 [Gnathostoma spinigerum]|uniref:Cytochrome c oxidase subunit n=1 Tax=Gnathostoma spinigerum TaxID=75299 RepID=A0ABD6ERF1_9BILA
MASYLCRNIALTTRIVAYRSARLAHNVGEFDSLKEAAQQMKDSQSTRDMWKKIFFLCSLPCLALVMYTSYVDHTHHDRKAEREKYVAYPYLNVRNKPFPWGDGNHTFFHNKETQHVPGVGFEVDLEKEK